MHPIGNAMARRKPTGRKGEIESEQAKGIRNEIFSQVIQQMESLVEHTLGFALLEGWVSIPMGPLCCDRVDEPEKGFFAGAFGIALGTALGSAFGIALGTGFGTAFGIGFGGIFT